MPSWDYQEDSDRKMLSSSRATLSHHPSRPGAHAGEFRGSATEVRVSDWNAPRLSPSEGKTGNPRRRSELDEEPGTIEHSPSLEVPEDGLHTVARYVPTRGE